jgi:ribokinase
VRAPRLLVVGDIAWDVLVRPQTDLVWGSDVFGAVELLPGGSAANVAVWAHRLGAQVTLVGKLGADPLGELMLRHLASEGLAASVMSVPGASTTRIGVLIRPQGEHAFITDHSRLPGFVPGDLPTSMLDDIDTVFFNGYGVFTSGSAAFITGLLQEARRRGVRIAFDPSSFALINAYGAARLLDEVAPLEILLANEDEVRALAPGQALPVLQRRAELIVIKQGAEGASAYAAAASYCAGPFAADPVDTTGAGDAFDAAFLVHIVRDGDVEHALRAANRLGAYVAGFTGAQPVAPDWIASAR